MIRLLKAVGLALLIVGFAVVLGSIIGFLVFWIGPAIFPLTVFGIFFIGLVCWIYEDLGD